MQRTVQKIDAAGKILGRLASEIALVLQGKKKIGYRPNIAAGDIVEVSNAGAIKVSGRKLTQKEYIHHSGYLGGLKTIGLKEQLKKDPAFVLRQAVYHMLPRNKLRKEMMKRLRFIN